MSDYEKHVEELVEKAAKANQSHDALHYSQSALNAANALRQLADTRANAKGQNS